MRLHTVETGHCLPQKLLLWMIRILSGDPSQPHDVLKTLLYRSAFFGSPFTDILHDVMRGPSSWTVGERELFAAFTSRLNQCRY